MNSRRNFVNRATEDQHCREQERPINPHCCLPVAPVVGTLCILLIVHIVVCHQQVLPLDQVFVVFSHVWADAKAISETDVSSSNFTAQKPSSPRNVLDAAHSCFPPKNVKMPVISKI